MSQSIRCGTSATVQAARWVTLAEALRRGAKVILVSGPTALTPPSAAETIFVETAQQMRTAVLDRWERASLIIMAAAVATGKSTPLFIGFAAETEHLLENARTKLLKKRVDAIVLNDVSRADIGFNSDHNEVTIVTATETVAVPETSKLDVAQKILEAAVHMRRQQAKLVASPVRS